jgi:hypothetical protein
MQNLEKIVTHPLVAAHKARIILVAPPPINEHLQWITDQGNGDKVVSRRATTTKSYADAVCEVAKKNGAAVVNLWKAFMARVAFNVDTWRTGDPIPGSIDVVPNGALVELMYDGMLRSIQNPMVVLMGCKVFTSIQLATISFIKRQ